MTTVAGVLLLGTAVLALLSRHGWNRALMSCIPVLGILAVLAAEPRWPVRVGISVLTLMNLAIAGALRRG